METVDTLIHARWIIPVEPADTLLHDHSLAVRQNRILDLLPRAEAERRYRSRQTHTLSHHVLIPGLINAHTHAGMNLLRGYADDHRLMDWLQKYIWPAESRWVNEQFVQAGTALAAAEMIRSGVTCFNDMYFYPETAARVAQHAGLRAVIGLILLDFPSAWAGNSDEYLEKGLALHDSLLHDPLIRTAFAPHAPYTVSDQPLERVAALSGELELPVHIHLHETAQEITDSLAQHGCRPLERLQRLGLVSPALVAVHMTQLEDDEIELLAQQGVSVVHCPESNMKLASGICPAARLLDAGVNVTLGTDSVASNNDLDMLGEMRSAALLAKVHSDDAEAVPAFTALQMATLNAARALGLDDMVGSLCPGKAADLVAIDFDAVETQPVYDPVSTLVYTCRPHNVSHVWVNGRLLLNNRDFCTIEIESVMADARMWAEKIGRAG